MSTSGRVIKNTIYLYTKSIVSMVIMLLVTRIVLQALGVIDYGIYNVVAGSIAILGFFRNSLAMTMQRFLNHYQGCDNFDKQKQVFNIGIIFHWIVAIMLVLFFVCLGYYLFNGILNIPDNRIDAAKLVFLCLIVNTFLTIITAPYDAAITAHEDMFVYSVVGIIDAFLKLAVAFFVVFVSGDKLIIYAVLMMIIPFFETAVMRIYCKRNYTECIFRPKKEWNGILAKEMLQFAGWSLLGASTNVISNHGTNLALNHFFGAAINAVAGIANQIQGVLAILFTGLLKSLTPVIFKSEGASNNKRMLLYSYMGCKYATLLFALLAIPVFIETPYLMKLWLVEVPEWTILFVRLQLVRAIVEQLGSSLTNLLHATNHVKGINRCAIIYNLLPLLILVLLYSHGFPPYWHYIIMISFMGFGQLVTQLYYCRKYCELHLCEYIKTVIVPCLVITSFTMLGGTVALLITHPIIRLFSCFLLTTSILIIFSYCFMNYDEQNMVKVFCTSLKSRIKKQ